MAEPVHIAMVLKHEYRTPGGVVRVRIIAATLGIEITGVGQAAVSGTLSASLYQLLFELDAGSETREIAEPLRDLVESVSILPTLRQP